MPGKNIIKTGIYKMDELLAQGIPKGRSLIYYIQPGVDGEMFGLQTIYNTLENGSKGVFVVSSTSPDDIREQIKGLNQGNVTDKDRLLFVDGYNPLIGAPSKEKYVISNPYSIQELSNTVKNILKEIPPTTIVFGSLSTIMELCGEIETIEAVKTWNKMAKSYKHVLVYNFTAWSYSPETLDMIKRKLFNAVITIGSITEHVITGQCFRIFKLDWKTGQEETICFEPDGNNVFQRIDGRLAKPIPYLGYRIGRCQCKDCPGKQYNGVSGILSQIIQNV